MRHWDTPRNRVRLRKWPKLLGGHPRQRNTREGVGNVTELRSHKTKQANHCNAQRVQKEKKEKQDRVKDRWRMWPGGM